MINLDGMMDIDKLKTSWKALDEQTSELEEENRMLAREALRRRIDKTKIFFIWHNALILFCMALVLFVLPQLTPSPWLDWAVRVCGVWALYLIFRASFEFALLSKIDAAKSSVVEVCRNMSRFRKYSVGMYLVSEIIGIVALTLVMVYVFSLEEGMVTAGLTGFSIGFVIAILLFVKYLHKLRDLKKEAEELSGLE
jgi:hypothetical protein